MTSFNFQRSTSSRLHYSLVSLTSFGNIEMDEPSERKRDPISSHRTVNSDFCLEMSSG